MRGLRVRAEQHGLHVRDRHLRDLRLPGLLKAPGLALRRDAHARLASAAAAR
jgi:hypothetical protein